MYSSNKSGDNALDDANTITRSICTSDQPQSSVQRMSSPWPNTTISPLGLVQEVLRSPESKGDSEGESVITLDVDNRHLAVCLNLKLWQRLYFMVRKLA